jgi:rhamnosyl/mannosyltransferase
VSVLLLTTPYYKPRVGGVENYTSHLAEGLRREGWDVVVACGDTALTTPVREFVDDVTVWRLPASRVVSNTPVDLRWYRWLRQIIETERPDVINTHTPVPFMADVTILAAGRIPVVVTYHAATLFKPSSPAMVAVTYAYLTIQRVTLWRAAAVIAVSEYVRTALGPTYAAKTRVIHNAADVPATLPADAGRVGLVFVANLEPTHRWKGLGEILEALGRLSAAGQEVPRLVVIGDGGARAEYESQARSLGIAEHVVFAGRQTGADRDGLMAQAAALVAYPTTANDAFPTVFLEAWALGLPVIAADMGPLPSLLAGTDAGILVPAREPAALAAAISTLLADDTRLRAMGKAAHELVLSRYTWDRSVAQTEALFAELRRTGRLGPAPAGHLDVTRLPVQRGAGLPGRLRPSLDRLAAGVRGRLGHRR